MMSKISWQLDAVHERLSTIGGYVDVLNVKIVKLSKEFCTFETIYFDLVTFL